MDHSFVIFLCNELWHTHKQEMELRTCVCTFFHFCQLFTDHWRGRMLVLSSGISLIFYLSYFVLFYSVLPSSASISTSTLLLAKMALFAIPPNHPLTYPTTPEKSSETVSFSTFAKLSFNFNFKLVGSWDSLILNFSSHPPPPTQPPMKVYFDSLT